MAIVIVYPVHKKKILTLEIFILNSKVEQFTSIFCGILCM